MKYLPAIIIGILAFGMGLAAAATYPGVFSNLYQITGASLAALAVIVGIAIADEVEL